MKINEIIKERRLAKNMTQEQVASYLGVTAPAVNKWEKGSSYPDITLLPPLARLLDTDLNTLLSFQEELTDKEITLFLNYLSELYEADGFETAYTAAMEKIKEYPSCYPLLLNAALFLDGALSLDRRKDIPQEQYLASIESLYERAQNSQDSRIRDTAQSMLISRYMGRKEYDKAEELLQSMPEKPPVDKKQLQVNLLIANGKLEEAAKLEEEKLLITASEIQSTLATLMEIALKQDRSEDAEAIAGISEKAVSLFDLWELSSYAAQFQLYSARKDKPHCLKLLLSMLKSLNSKWEINKSPLYRHIKTKEPEKGLGAKMRNSILQGICESRDMEFLTQSKEFQDAIQEWTTPQQTK